MSLAEGPQREHAGAGHPTSGIDETVHQRHRLGILTITAEAQRAEFGYLREALGLTAGNLSKHLTVLEQAGMVEVDKGYAGRRPRTWVRITAAGRAALAAELAALTELLRRHTAANRDAGHQELRRGTAGCLSAQARHGRRVLRYSGEHGPAGRTAGDGEQDGSGQG
jgi:DNA-binding MarR family transcriptional regulator